MNYPEIASFDRTINGNANRIDVDVSPHVLLVDIAPHNRTARLHFAGESSVRRGKITDLPRDTEPIEDMKLIDAFRIGRASYGH